MNSSRFSYAKQGLCLLCACSLFVSNLSAATITATLSGNWNSNSTWDLNRQPAVGDNIYIPTGATVTIPSNIAINLSASSTTELNLTGGTLVFASNTSYLMLSSISALNWWSGTIDPGSSNSGNHAYIRIGTCGNNGTCEYTKTEIQALTPPVSFTNSGSSSLLPVELKSFIARLAKPAVSLEWVTASERNNSGFEVQRSTDGIDFQRIGWRDGNGTTSAERRYVFLDPSPTVGFNYYRLMQVDFDGQAMASPVQVVKMETFSKLSLKMSAHRQQLRILLPEAANGQAEIYDLTGKLVLHKSLGYNDLEVQFDLAGLPDGWYLARVGGQAQAFCKF